MKLTTSISRAYVVLLAFDVVAKKHVDAWTASGRSQYNSANMTRKTFLSKIIIIPAIILPTAATRVQKSSAQELDGGSSVPTSNSSPISTSSTEKDTVDAFSALGKDINSMNFDSWTPDANSSTDKDTRDDTPDLAGAIIKSKRKRAVDPRTHG